MITFPYNPARALKVMEIGIDLESVEDSTIFGCAIHEAVKRNKIKQIMNEIYQQSKDNRNAVSDIVGEKTLRKIEKFYD